MPPFLLYLLKANAVIAVLLLAYLLLLKNATFFGLNRVFLLGTLLLSLALPLAPPVTYPGITGLQQRITDHYPGALFQDGINGTAQRVVPAGGPSGGQSRPASAAAGKYPPGQLVAGLYVLVAAALLVRFGVQLNRVFSLVRANRRHVREGITYCEHDRELSPFSFLGYLVLNPAPYTAEQLRQIEAHEKVHIRQWHTADILLAELVHIFLWANPLVPLLKQYLKLNLEYIADRQVLGTGIDKKSYQWSILRSCVKTTAYPLTNPFHSSKLKLRIQMMNTHKSPFRHLYRYALVLPLGAVLYLFVNGCERGPVRTQEGRNTGLFKSPLATFEGYYTHQFTPGEDAFLKISSQGDGLVLKELWSGRQITFTRKSELEFTGLNGSFPLKFTKDESGAITQVLAFDRDLWNRTAGFTPTVRKELSLSPGQLQAYAGYYQKQDNKEIYLQISVKENGLVLKETWNGHELPFVPTSETNFQPRDREVNFPLQFTRTNGAVTQLLAFGKDVWIRDDHYQPKTEISLPPAQLEAFTGKYRMAGRSESIEITAQGEGLVLKESWSGNEISFVPENELAFFAKDRFFPLRFTRDDSGNVTEVLAFGRDLWVRVKE